MSFALVLLTVRVPFLDFELHNPFCEKGEIQTLASWQSTQKGFEEEVANSTIERLTLSVYISVALIGEDWSAVVVSVNEDRPTPVGNDDSFGAFENNACVVSVR